MRIALSGVTAHGPSGPDPVLADTPALAHDSVERALMFARLAGGALIALIGPFFPNLGLPFILAASALLFALAAASFALPRISDPRTRLRLYRVSFVGDLTVAVIAFAAFSPDPTWPVLVAGPLVIIVGGFRFGATGAVIAALVLAAFSLATDVMRARYLGLAVEPARTATYLAVYFIGALLVSALVGRLETLTRLQAGAYDADRQRSATEDAYRGRQQDAFSALRLRAISGEELSTFMAFAADLIRSVVVADRCAIWEVLPRRRTLVAKTASGTDAPMSDLPLASDALEARALRAANGQASDAGPGANEVTAIALALLPLRSSPGVLTVRFSTARHLTGDERNFLTGCASLIGAAAHRAAQERENRELQTRLHQLERLETVGTLAGGMAHEFNNLLMAMLSHASLALEQLPPTSPARADIEQIRRAATGAADLTRQLLIFSRRETTSPEVLDLNQVVTRAERLLSRAAGGAVSLTTLLDPHLLAVKIDPARVEQVLLNLALNARDAMPSGGVLRIETVNELREEGYRQMPPGRYVRLTVADTGAGMTEEVAERAFEPFFTTKPTGRGTGLGLAMVYGIVKQAGGYVFIDSEPGRGTTVSVHLPPTDEPPAAAPRPAAPVRHAAAGETILLVEDAPAVRDVVTRMLSRRGYTVLSAAGAQEALRLEHRHHGPIALLLTDVVVPDVPGPQLAGRLRRWHPAMKVLYMSGHARDVIDTQGAIDAPLLQKPFTEAELLRAVGDVLAGADSDRRGGAPQVRVVIVEDHWLVADALSRTLRHHDIAVVGVAASVAEARSLAAHVEADVALVDYYLPDGTGADAARALREVRPETAVVVLTGAPSEDALRRAVEAGACGFFAKTQPPSEIVAAVRRAADGDLLLDAQALRQLVGAAARPEEVPQRPRDDFQLTPREREVLLLIAEGLTNATMAERLGVGITTVRSHVRGVIEKLGVNSKLQAIVRAQEQGLLNEIGVR